MQRDRLHWAHEFIRLHIPIMRVLIDIFVSVFLPRVSRRGGMHVGFGSSVE